MVDEEPDPWIMVGSAEAINAIFSRAASIKADRIKLSYCITVKFFDCIRVTENNYWKAWTQPKRGGKRIRTQVIIGHSDI